MNSLFDYLLHGARLRRKFGSIDGAPIAAGKVRLDVYLAAAPWTRLPRLHLECVRTSVLSYDATSLQLDTVGTESLLSALRDGHEAWVRAQRLRLIGQQQLHVEPHVSNRMPRPAKLTFLYSALLLAHEWRTIELEGEAVAGLVSMLDQVHALLLPAEAAA